MRHPFCVLAKMLSIGVHQTSMQPFPQYGEAEKRAVAEYVLELRAELLATEDPAP